MGRKWRSRDRAVARKVFASLVSMPCVLGKEVELVRFPAESHELTRSGSPVHRVMRFEILLDWFDRYLKDGLIGLFRGRLPGRQPPALSPVT